MGQDRTVQGERFYRRVAGLKGGKDIVHRMLRIVKTRCTASGTRIIAPQCRTTSTEHLA
jgi:hypothetical protein